MPDRTALVTGAAGFIGQHLTRTLAANGWAIRGIDDERSGDWSRISAAVERETRSLETLSPQELADACDGADVLFHLAAEKYNSPRATAATLIDVNVAATERLFSAAARAGVGTTVFTSSLYAYGSTGPAPMAERDVPRPATCYGVSKLAGEHLLRVTERNHGARWTVARLFFVYGPGQHAEGGYKSVLPSNFERINRGERPTVYGDGQQRLDYVYVDDCVRALVAMAGPEHHGRTYNVASGRGVTINELTRTMLDVAGSDLAPRHCPPDWTHGTVRVGDPTHAAQVLRWRVTTPLDLGVRRVWRSMTADE